MWIRRTVFGVVCGLFCVLLSGAAASAQGGQFFKRYTAPQVVAGSGLSSEIVLLNTSNTTCEFGVFAHQGAGNLNPDVTVGGQPGGFTTSSVGPHGGRAISIEASEGSFLGAATVDLLTPECFNSFTTQVQYRLRGTDGRLNELFSYPTPQAVKPGQCATAAVTLDLDSSDGTRTESGFASVSVTPLQDTRLCHTLKDRRGLPVTQEICNPTDGSHQAQLVTDIFTGGFQSGNVTTWQVCVDALEGSDQPVRVDPLFIEVATEGGTTQFDGSEHQISRPGCREDEFNVCLDDRFQVSVNWRESPTGPTQRAGVGAVTPDQSGLFFFQNNDNLELLVKMFNGCPVNDRFWVFYGSATNVEFTLTVTDTQADETRTFTQPLGMPADAITDTQAFSTCP